jgi:hypothetical protein
LFFLRGAACVFRGKCAPLRDLLHRATPNAPPRFKSSLRVPTTRV